jgi:hypothetical protein
MFDRKLASVTTGSVVIHPMVMTGELRQHLEQFFARAGLTIDAFTVGNDANQKDADGKLLF